VRPCREHLSKSPRCFSHTRPFYIAALRFVRDYLWRGLAHFELGAYFLDLRGLLFELGNHCLHLVFQLGNGCLLFLDFFVFFEELVEQHRIDLLPADGVGFSFLHYCQVRTHFCYFFSNQAPFGRLGVVLIVEGHWSKRKDHFTGLAHRLNVLLEPRRRGRGTKLAGGEVNPHWQWVRGYASDLISDATYKTGRCSRQPRQVGADPDRGVFITRTAHACADIGVKGTYGYASTGHETHDCV